MAGRYGRWRSTTIVAVRHQGRIALGGDGQVSLGDTIVKEDAVKVRWLADSKVLVGFAGAAADAFALLERLEARLRDFHGSLPRAATELARDWRTDRALRRLEAMLVAADQANLLLIGGNGDVISPSDGILGIGSGGPFALAAARALVAHSTLGAADIVRESLRIAGGISVYSNASVAVEELECAS
jgi:ATP-dependent HslUV protease subunit HslV